MSDRAAEYTPRGSTPEALAEAQEKAEEALVGGSDPRSATTISGENSSKTFLGRFLHRLGHVDHPRSGQDGDLSNPVLKAKAEDLEARTMDNALSSLPPQPQQKDE